MTYHCGGCELPYESKEVGPRASYCPRCNPDAVWNTPLTQVKAFQIGSGEMGTLYWSKDADLDKFPEMNSATSEQMDNLRKRADGSWSVKPPFYCGDWESNVACRCVIQCNGCAMREKQ